MSPIAAAEPNFLTDVRPLLDTYCASCHNAEKAKGEVDFSRYTSDDAARSATRLWRSAGEQVQRHEMPPASAKTQPSPAERERLLAGLAAFNRYRGQPDPGRVTLRRLNRLEYDLTIRDLLGLDLRTARDGFPSDDVGEGFDNIGDVLSLPPLLLEKYLEAAGTILDQAIVQQQIAIATTAAQLPAMQEGKSLPAETQAGARDFTGLGEVTLAVTVPADGKFTLKFRAGADQAGRDPAVVLVKLDQQAVKDVKVTARRKSPAWITVPLTLTKGPHVIGLKFTNPFSKPAGAGHVANGPAVKQDERKPAVRLLSITEVTLTGPPMPKPGEAHRRIFIAEPGAELSATEAARRIIERFASRAFRRPVTKPALDRLLVIFDLASRQGETFESAIGFALKAALVSPSFLYRVEEDRTPTLPNQGFALDSYEIASRLSYFLWSSMPDDELFALAAQGTLTDPKVIDAQVRRLLQDPKAAAFSTAFGEQWLTLRALDSVQPDPKRFPTFTRELRQAMRDEALMFFSNLVHENRSILEFIDADYTFLNERLAKHYGITGVSGPQMRRVTLSDRNRGGVLTMAGVLTVTSQPGRTSPVKRGKWILEQIVGEPPPPAPPVVEQLPGPGEPATAGLSLRKMMERHRQDPACASCHAKMDAIGFGLENFDPIGGWRSQDQGLPLDTAGELPGGTTFSGPRDLKAVFLGRKDAFTRNLSEKMLIFALGRGLTEVDEPVIDRISAAVAADGHRFATLVTQVALSFPFRHRRLP